jgi:hypothetical protein
VHELRPNGVVTHEDWPAPDVAAAAEQSSLPPHPIAQIDDYLARLGTFDRAFVHGDLCAMHVFVENGRLTGIIDWGDAKVADRHYELIQIYLEACEWPVGKDFPRQARGLALWRQAVGLAQHHTIDVFEPIAALLPLRDIGTLDEPATGLFAVWSRGAESRSQGWAGVRTIETAERPVGLTSVSANASRYPEAETVTVTLPSGIPPRAQTPKASVTLALATSSASFAARWSGGN